MTRYSLMHFYTLQKWSVKRGSNLKMFFISKYLNSNLDTRGDGVPKFIVRFVPKNEP